MIALPAGWRRIRTKYLYRVVDERAGSAVLPLLAVSIHLGVVPRDTLTVDEPRADDLNRYKRCSAGDIVLNRMRAFQGAVGIAPQAGIVSPDYVVLRLVDGVDSRFFHHLFRSSWFVGEMTARLRGIGGSDQGNVRTPRINVEDFGEIKLALPPLADQREIAAFLDREVARFDRLIESKRRMFALLVDRLWSLVEARLPSAEVPMQALGRNITSACDGPFGSWLTSAHYSDDGARVIRLGNIGRAAFKDDDRAFIPLDHYERLRRHAVVAGDLVVAGLGDEGNPLGRACVAPAGIEPAIVKADCFRLRLDRTRLLPEFAAWWLSSTRGGGMILEAARGSTRQRMNLGAVSRVPLPVPHVDEQQQVVDDLDEHRERISRTTRVIEQQIAVLDERRKTLVTVAVTGGLDVARAVA